MRMTRLLAARIFKMKLECTPLSAASYRPR